MRRACCLSWLIALAMTLSAQVPDAFHGVLPVTDPAMKKSLNGEWNIKVENEIVACADGVLHQPVPALDDSWSKIPVPGCWEAYGLCLPKYDSAAPLTGFYRTSFSIPEAWKGQRIVLRMDGVLYGYDLWINDHYVDSWYAGYNTALFDITDYLIPKKKKGRGWEAPQQLALRVITSFSSSDFDYNDDWAPSGIFRDVTLMAVPDTHLSVLTITTKNNGEVTVDAEVAHATKTTTVAHEILDAQGRLVGTDKVDHPHLWTAETPYLYTLRTTLAQKGKTLQTFEHKFGFRELTIDGNILKLNGQPIKLRGVTCHSTDPNTVKVIDEKSILRDMKLMKEASVNYIRTSHYPREPRFYELADSLGFYIIDEVPFGFGDKHLYDSTYYAVLQQRAQATIRRDKNHPSVLIWSLGNENPLTDICVKLGNFVKEKLDPNRPYCYPQVGSYFRKFFEGEKAKGFPSKAPVYTPHYPTTGQIAGFYQHLDRPVIFTEYCHSLGISFEDHDRQWEIIERTPGIAGGSVWEWVDQGMPFREKLADRYGYEERVFTSDEGGFEMWGNKGTDGLLYADRTPLPNYYELQRNYARSFIADSILVANGASLHLDIRNRFDFLDLKDHVRFHWTYTEDRDTISRGVFSVSCPPRQSVGYDLELPSSPRRQKIGLLHCELMDAQGYVFLHQSIPVCPSSDGVSTEMPLIAEALSVDKRILAAFDESDSKQRLAADNFQHSADLMDMVQDGPLIRAGRKVTMAEKLKVGDKRLERYLLHPSSESASSVIPEGKGKMGSDIRLEPVGNAIRCTFSLSPDTTDTFLSELGVAFLLQPEIDRVQWIGYGPLPSYPGRCRANRYGFWAMQQGDLYFEGNRRGVDAALLTDKEGDGILLVCHQQNVSFEQTDRGIVVTVNVAVSGQGPKFARTAFPVIAKNVGTVTGEFMLYRVKKGCLPKQLSDLFLSPTAIPSPHRPFKTQYDTYLMRYEDIIE